MMQHEELINRLIGHTTSDETRYHLTDIHYDGERFVSTDGHRLISVDRTKLPAFKGLTAGKTYESKILKDWHCIEIECKYPNYKQLIPDKKDAKWIFRVVIPQWTGRVKPVRKFKEGMHIGIDESGQFTMGKALQYFDVNYLGAYAGVEVDFHIINELGPALLIPVDKTEGWEAVLMPIRWNAWPVEVLKKPEAQ